MNTINGIIDLSSSYGCSTKILDINTGLKIDVIIERRKLEYQKFYIFPYIYSLSKDWYIEQPEGRILVGNLENLTDIHKKYGKIYNKFKKLVDFTLMDDGTWHFGFPSVNQWVDKMIIVSKDT